MMIEDQKAKPRAETFHLSRIIKIDFCFLNLLPLPGFYFSETFFYFSKTFYLSGIIHLGLGRGMLVSEHLATCCNLSIHLFVNIHVYLRCFKISSGGAGYRYSIRYIEYKITFIPSVTPTQMDVAPKCYKWIGMGSPGGIGGTEHLNRSKNC